MMLSVVMLSLLGMAAANPTCYVPDRQWRYCKPVTGRQCSGMTPSLLRGRATAWSTPAACCTSTWGAAAATWCARPELVAQALTTPVILGCDQFNMGRPNGAVSDAYIIYEAPQRSYADANLVCAAAGGALFSRPEPQSWKGYGFNYDLPTGTSKPLQSTYFMGPTSAYCTDACQPGQVPGVEECAVIPPLAAPYFPQATAMCLTQPCQMPASFVCHVVGQYAVRKLCLQTPQARANFWVTYVTKDAPRYWFFDFFNIRI